jgi:hypothetical protein
MSPIQFDGRLVRDQKLSMTIRPMKQFWATTMCTNTTTTKPAGTRADDARVPATILRIYVFRRAVSYSVINGSDGFMYIHYLAQMSLDQWRNLGIEFESPFSADEIPCVTCICVCVGDEISWNAWRKVDDRMKCSRLGWLVSLSILIVQVLQVFIIDTTHFRAPRDG